MLDEIGLLCVLLAASLSCYDGEIPEGPSPSAVDLYEEQSEDGSLVPATAEAEHVEVESREPPPFHRCRRRGPTYRVGERHGDGDSYSDLSWPVWSLPAV